MVVPIERCMAEQPALTSATSHLLLVQTHTTTIGKLAMKAIRIDHDTEGESHFSNHEWPLQEGSFTPPSPAGYFTTSQIATDGLLMMHHPAGYEDDWHTAPAAVLGTVLTGMVRIQASDMDTRVLQPGDQFLACDFKGKGHRMFEVNDGHYDLALVVLKSPPVRKRIGKCYASV